MRKIILSMLLLAVSAAGYTQTGKSYVVQGGGSGPYKAMVAGDVSLPAFTIYRPQDLKPLDTLPVLLYANGGCANSTVQMRFLLNDVASYGYIVIGIGPFEDEDPIENWKHVMDDMYPVGKDVVLANGERIPEPTSPEVLAHQAEMQKRFKGFMERYVPNARPATAASSPRPRTYPRQLLEALDWLTDQNADPASEYYGKVDLHHVAAMGQSCGGSQVVVIAHDPRLTTCILLNSGIGDGSMSGASKTMLEDHRTPLLYLVGGPTDIGYDNAVKDFAHVKGAPIVLINTPPDGHHGTFYEMYGGAYATAVRKWLDWHLKGKVGESALFLDTEYMHWKYPDWTVDRKNW